MKFENDTSISATNIICVKVEREKDFGYWEINPELKKAYFRDHRTLPPEDKVVSDYSPACKNIETYLKDHHDVNYVKYIIPDRKIIFADTPFCTYVRERTSDDGTVSRVYCQHPALVSVANSQDPDSPPKLYCGEHAPIGGGNSAANTTKTQMTTPEKISKK